ncbi:hypothetical protein R1flu_015956 [Riccia fluitans]|uniref:Aspartokinase n=1 Tax=Riccia fluitans TaxID=41844 RepID=A0ABD1YL93_9MARC
MAAAICCSSSLQQCTPYLPLKVEPVSDVQRRCQVGLSRWASSSSSSLFSEGLTASCVSQRAAPIVATRRGGVRCQNGAGVGVVEKVVERNPSKELLLTTVMKFGGSSVASAERMQEVANVILSFPLERPIIVLSAMGKTTNNLLKAGESAVNCGVGKACLINELTIIQKLHIETCQKLGLDESPVDELLKELESLITGIAMIKELTLRTRDYLVSFGERLSTRIFAAYLNKMGIKARQYDAFEIGFITTDDFSNADILDVSYEQVGQVLLEDYAKDPAIPIVTGFLGKGIKTGRITTLGRGGSDLTATALGRACSLREIQVWKDVDGVLTCDPNVHKGAIPVKELTFDEAAELSYFGAQVLHPQSMRPAREADIPVRVKNSYNVKAPGTLIKKSRDLSEAQLTSIVLKKSVTMLDIISTRMLGQYGFLGKVFSVFAENGISVDVVATSEVSISLTLDPAKLWERELIEQELQRLQDELSGIAMVNLVQNRSIISLIGNHQCFSHILEKAFSVMRKKGINAQMISQGASKANVSLVVDDTEAVDLVKSLHEVFFDC